MGSWSRRRGPSASGLGRGAPRGIPHPPAEFPYPRHGGARDYAWSEALRCLSRVSRTGRTGHGGARRRASLGSSGTKRRGSSSSIAGFVAVDERATGRGRASTVRLVFAETGPWWDGDVDAELVDAVLGCSRSSRPARPLLATMAAVADEDCVVRGPVDGAAPHRWVEKVGRSMKAQKQRKSSDRLGTIVGGEDPLELLAGDFSWLDAVIVGARGRSPARVDEPP
jgi:hypothetical protein